MSDFHIVQAGIDNGDWEWIQGATPAARSAAWTVPKTARIGDRVAVYVQTLGIVATARVAGTPKLRLRWRNRYGAKLTEFRRLREPLTLDSLRSALPDFAWLRYPRSITTPPPDVAAALANLIAGNSLGRSAPRRSGAVYAREIFEALFPTLGVRKSVARLLANTLRTASSITTAWSVVLEDDCIKVNVGPVQLMSLWSGYVWMCALERQRAKLPRGWTDVSHGSVVYPRSVSVRSRQYSVEGSAIGATPADLKNAVLGYVRAAAGRRSGLSSWHYAHSEGVLAYLDGFLRTTLPRPAQREAGEAAEHLLPDETADRVYDEGSRMYVAVNRYERSAAAREACVARWGTRCAVCELDFGEFYGRFAKGFVHVHHLRPLSGLGEEYAIDPVKDLRPVCPNCHAAIHIGGECRSIETLRKLLRKRR